MVLLSFPLPEMQLEASREKIQELEEQIRHQPMSVVDARDLHQSIKNTEDMLEMVRVQDDESAGRISELQMQHNRSVISASGGLGLGAAQQVS